MSDDVFAAVVSNTRVRAITDDRALISALLRAETALTRAQSKAGILPDAAADAVARACSGEFDVASLVRDTALGGNPVIPLVASIRELVPDCADDVHRGATSQDILDTALMLMSRDSLDVIWQDLGRCTTQLESLEKLDTTIIGRTLMQQAVPMAAAVKFGTWARAIEAMRERLRSIGSTLPVQLGGPVGDGTTFGEEYAAVRAGFAAELGLADSPSWHTMRIPVADLAAALATTSGVVAKIAGDIVLLAQNEVGEVSETGTGRGGSSSMAHKSNPIAAISARASAKRAPFLAAHLFAQMEQEHERAAGAWHAEWAVLVDLLRASGSASAWLADSLERLTIDVEAVENNL